MRGRQISVRHLAYELPIPTTTVYEIISNHSGMKKVLTRGVPKLRTSIQRANRVDCCQELLQESKVNPDKYFDRIVTGDEIWVYYYDPLSQQEAKLWKKLIEETPTRLRRTRPAENIMMVIFWDKYGILPTEYLPGGTTIGGLYYASIIERLRCAILKKRRGKVSDGVLLIHDNAPVHKCSIVQAGIRKAGFVELNHPMPILQILHRLIIIYSQIWRNFFVTKNFSRSNETIDTVEDYLNNLDWKSFCKGIQSLHDR